MMLLAFAESIQLFPDGTIFIHIALILVMIWVLNRTFFQPINRVIESRERLKGGAVSEADAILREAADKESRYQTAVLEARSRGYQIIEEKHTESVVRREQELKAAKSEAADRLSKEKRELERQAAEARARIDSEADLIADKIAENILK